MKQVNIKGLSGVMGEEFDYSFVKLPVRGGYANISAIYRQGDLSPIVFLHGFGSSKEDYADIIRHPSFSDHPFLAYDAPACGESSCSNPDDISIGYLVETALQMLDHVGFDRFHLVGHSMGGLTALELAHAHPSKVISFVDIEGNIAPEDCFLSRQIIDYPSDYPDIFLNEFIKRTRFSSAWSSPLYAANLRHKVRANAVKGIFSSMVDLSDHGNLMEKFLNLPFPRLFMYGEQNSNLSYLDHIQEHGVSLAEIPQCGHFPMYSNPVAMWKSISDFQKKSEGK